MFQDTSFNCQGSQSSGQLDLAATPFPSLMVFPPEIDNPDSGEHETVDWIDNLTVDDDKKFTESRGGSIPLTPQMSVNPYCNIQQLPSQQEMYFGLSSPSWSTTESDFSSPAHTLPRTPNALYPTPVLGTQHLHRNHTPTNAPAHPFGGELTMFSPAHSPWAVPATVPSPATVAAGASTRDVTRDNRHATRYERSQPRHGLPPSFGIPIASPAYGSEENGLQLTLHEPAALCGDGSAHLLVSYGSVAPGDGALAGSSSYSFDPYGADGHLNGTILAAKGEDAKDVMKYMPSSNQPDKKKPFACEHCSRAFARTQDLTRHMKTVHGEGKQWVCCGVPMTEAHNFKISANAVRIGPMEHEGVLMIGGCGREFGRKDTYAKHLKSVRTCCVGDVNALYHSENMKKACKFRLARASWK